MPCTQNMSVECYVCKSLGWYFSGFTWKCRIADSLCVCVCFSHMQYKAVHVIYIYILCESPTTSVRVRLKMWALWFYSSINPSDAEFVQHPEKYCDSPSVCLTCHDQEVFSAENSGFGLKATSSPSAVTHSRMCTRHTPSLTLHFKLIIFHPSDKSNKSLQEGKSGRGKERPREHDKDAEMERK